MSDTEFLSRGDAGPTNWIKKTGTGASLAAYPADPVRKGPGVPNEDAYSAQNVTLSGDDAGQQLLRVVQHVADRKAERQDGATITTALIDGHTLHTANLGDSIVAVITVDPTKGLNPVKVTQVTRDHVANDDEERSKLPKPETAARLGRKWRVYMDDTHNGAGLMLSRMGGMDAFPLNRTVEHRSYDMGPDLAAGKQVYVVAASDSLIEGTDIGEIEKMLNAQYIDTRLKEGRPPNADELANFLSQYQYSDAAGARFYRRNDDTTILVQPVEAAPTPTQPGGKREAKLLTVSDGTGFKFQPPKTMEELRTGDYTLVPLYEKPLSQVFAEEVPRFMQAPHLMSDATVSRARPGQ